MLIGVISSVQKTITYNNIFGSIIGGTTILTNVLGNPFGSARFAITMVGATTLLNLVSIGIHDAINYVFQDPAGDPVFSFESNDVPTNYTIFSRLNFASGISFDCPIPENFFVAIQYTVLPINPTITFKMTLTGS